MIDQDLTQRAFTTILEHFVATGRAPHYVELAGALDIGSEEAREVQRAAVEASPILARKFQAQLLTDVARNLLLQGEDVRRLAPVLLAPQLRLLPHVDQLRPDQEPAATSATRPVSTARTPS